MTTGNTPMADVHANIGRNESLDLLRGIAILLVIVIHSWQAAPGYFSVTNTLAAYGPYGVQLFFIISGYTMRLTFGTDFSRNAVGAFYVRRFFRIVPLFWAVALMYVLRKGMHPNFFAPDGVTISDMVLTFAFLQWLSPTAFNSVVPGGWSIAVEMQFYVLFPVFAWLFVRAKERIAFLPYLIIAAIYLAGDYLAANAVLPALYARFPAEQHYLADFFCESWLPRQMICFGFGFILFEMIERRRLPMIGLLVMTGCALYSSFGQTVLALFLMSLLVLAIGFRNGILATLGRHSYSIYLLHFDFAPIPRRLPSFIHLTAEIGIPLTTILAYLASRYITEPLIEARGIAFGKTIARRYFPRAAASKPGETLSP